MNRFEVFVILVFCISWSHCRIKSGFHSLTQESHEECLNRVYKRNCSDTSDDSRVTEKEKDVIVNLHNHYRQLTAEGKVTIVSGGTLPKAADMMKMKWDNELQMSAERWADYCINGTDSCVTDKRWRVGICEVYIPCSPHKFNWTRAVEYIFENRIYISESDVGYFSPKQRYCVHQNLWHDTYAIGCAKKYFNSYCFYFCNYGSGERPRGKPMYEVGNPCSKCPSGTVCENSLCAFTTKRELNEELSVAMANIEYRTDDIKKCVVKKFSDISVLIETMGRIIGEGGKLDLTVGEALSKKLKLVKDRINSIAQFLNHLENGKDVGQNYVRSWLTELHTGQTNPLLNVTSPPKIANINNMVNKLSKVIENIKLSKYADEGLVKKLENQIADISDLVETYLLLVGAEGNPNGGPVDKSEAKFSNIDSVIEDIEEKLDRKGKISDNTVEDLSSIVSGLRNSLDALVKAGGTGVIDNEKDTIKRNNEIYDIIRNLGKEIRNLISYQRDGLKDNLNGIKNITNDLTKSLDEIIEESMSFPEKLEKQIVRFETKVENIGEIFDNAEEPYINHKALESKLVELKNLLRNLIKTVKDRNPRKGELPDYIQKKLIKMQVTPMKLLVKMKKELKDIPEDLERKITDTNQMLGNLGGALENVMSNPLRDLLRDMFDISNMVDSYSKAESMKCRK